MNACPKEISHKVANISNKVLKFVQEYQEKNYVQTMINKRNALGLNQDASLTNILKPSYFQLAYQTHIRNFLEILQIIDETFLKADGFDDAVIGVDETTMRLIYSVKKCIEILIDEGMTYEDAMEHFSFNVSGAYVGEKTPIWCQDNFA